MKKLLGVLVLAVAGTACQHHAPPVATATVRKLPAPPAAAAPPAAVAKLPLLFAAADTLVAPMRQLLQTYDLSALWQNADDSDNNPTFEGFFGPDHYHFAMVFSQVKRDADNPTRYYVLGKCRYRKNIRPFSGTLTVRQIAGLAYPGFLQAVAISDSNAADSVAGRTYTARAQLQLREETKENSGIFEGEVLLDFYVVPSRPVGYVRVYNHEGIEPSLPTRGSGLLLQGNRLNVSTGQVKSFTVGPWLAAVAPNVYKDFMLDERMGQINPKYAKLGWNEHWENDEWWAATPKPKLSL
ncbi:MAG: hypothetical protein ACRYFX_28290 [Janthinobacterium lividum]